MLTTLSINNIALIDRSEIEFGEGLNILTGETGAGKSIIIDSLNFVLGGRADKTLIRYGESEATVEAEFDKVNERVQVMLDEYDIDATDGLIITRKMSVEGKNTCRINGVKLTVAVLKVIAGALVDIYGQHENSILLDSNTHIGIIDNYGADEIKNVKKEYLQVFKEYKEIKSKLTKFKSVDDVEIRLEYLEKKIKEIEEANITLGEEEKLQKLCDSYDNAESILQGLTSAFKALNDDEYNANDCISIAMRELSKVAEYNDIINELMPRLEELSIELSDIADTVAGQIGSVDFDEYEARDNIARLEYIRDVIDKFGRSEEDVINRYNEFVAEYDELGNAGLEVAKLSERLETVKTLLCEKARALTLARVNVSDKFSKKVVSELQELGMPNTTFAVDINREYDDEHIFNNLSESGVDKLEFLISPNAGQPLKPLSKIISGGEMSRFMLAIKKISAQIDGVNCMVFDEIDTGISGNIAQIVANKLSDISQHRQVLAVTHLPQLASMADNHYLIIKSTDNITTNTNVRLLNETERIQEVARIIDGANNSEFALLHAEKIIANANNYKAKRK